MNESRTPAVLDPDRIRVGVSACLLGANVRYDGGHKRDSFLTDTLAPFVEWVPVCPEVEVGLGVPRDTLRLVGQLTAPRLVIARTGEDITARMQRYARARTRELERLELDGYVFKRGSPSCGLFRVPVDGQLGTGGARASASFRTRRHEGRGLFAAELARRLPLLPLEEEGRLTDPAIRENFVERVFTAARWRAFVARRPRPRALIAFHEAHKLLVLAHSPQRYAELGRLVAGRARIENTQPATDRATGVEPCALEQYGRLLMEALAVRATRPRHVNVLQHAAGFFKRQLDTPARAEVADIIEEYRRGLVPLVVPITLIRHHVRRLGIAHLATQVYLSPHPKELMLRNHV